MTNEKGADERIMLVHPMDELTELVEKLATKLNNKELKHTLEEELSNKALKDALTKDNDLVNAWERMYKVLERTSQFTKDVSTLEKIAALSREGSAFRNKLGNQWSEVLDDILKNSTDLSCETCTGGRVGRSSIGQFMGDAEYFITNFNVNPGGKGEVFYNWIRGTTNPSSGQLDELHQTLRDIARRGIKESEVIGLGKQFPTGTKKYDLRKIGDKYTEYKNKDFVSSPLTKGSDDVDQFINGYLKNIKSLSDFEWKAGFDKLKSAWGTPENALVEMKKQWKKIFEEKADEIFKPVEDGGGFAPNKLEALFGTSNKSEFLEIIQDLNDEIYNFVKVE